MASVEFLEMCQGGDCKHHEKGSTDTLPPNAYAFFGEKLPEKAEAKWKELFCLFEPPPLLISRACVDGNGFFGCETSYDGANKLKTCNTWFRCLVKEVNQGREEYDLASKKIEYKWYEMTFLMSWEPERSNMYCFNCPDNMLQLLKTAISNRSTPLNFADPFSMYVPLMDEIVKLYDSSVWAVRHVLRQIEKRREKSAENEVDINFSVLHELLRHSMHVGEVLANAADNYEKLRGCRKNLLPLLPDRPYRPHKVVLDQDKVQDNIHYHMGFQKHVLQSMKLRQQSNQDRLQAETTLAFNIITQLDSKILRRDSKSMKTVAVLTMIFLPATFTSAIFGMNFFDFSPATSNEPETWSTSGRIYIFWIVAALLTLLTILAWFFLLIREKRDFKWVGKSFKKSEKKKIQDPEKQGLPV